MRIKDAFQNSLVLKELRQSKLAKQNFRIAFLDVDDTWTGKPAIQKRLRDELCKRGFSIVCVTNRASELCMSWQARDKSSREVRSSYDKGKIDPATLPEMTGLLDVDIIIASLGGELLVKQNHGGYEIDGEYVNAIPYSSLDWRLFVQKLLTTISHKARALFLERRVQLFFDTKKDRDQFTKNFLALQGKILTGPMKIARLIDESNEYAKTSTFSVMITQDHVNKISGVDRVMHILTEAGANHVEVLLAGDGPPDVEMGLFGAIGAKVIFVIPGNARITPFFKDKYSHSLQLQSKQGWYSFGNDSRTVIIGEEAFPNTQGPETLLALLNNYSFRPTT